MSRNHYYVILFVELKQKQLMSNTPASFGTAIAKHA